MSETTAPDQIEFIATIPSSAGAISIDGEPDAGGKLKLDISGDYLVPLLALTTVRGRALHITVVPQAPTSTRPKVDENQTALPFPAQGGDRESIEEQAAAAKARGFVVGEGSSADTDDGERVAADGHVHLYDADWFCVECGEPRWVSDPIDPATPADEALSTGPGNTTAGVGSARAHRVTRGVLRKRTKAKR